ncbi:MAG: DMT family transporter, partial [Clostridia bacterium]|nr:DMT family transporter [Clostridia bacterium]
AAVLYATVILLNKFIKGVAGIQRTFLQFVAAIIILIPYVAFTGGVTLGGMDMTGWICLLIVGIIHSAAAYCLYFSALKEVTGQAAAILSYADPLVAVVISVTILGEPISLMQLIGGILILGFTLLNEIELKPRKKL